MWRFAVAKNWRQPLQLLMLLLLSHIVTFWDTLNE
jgi:hypothetical protein